MQRKDSEQALGTMMRNQGYFVHKWRDRGFISCPTCHRLVMQCPNCHGSLLLPKAQTLPDFLVALNYAYVECKQGEESWSITDISEIQEHVLDDCNSSWIFLLLGTGRAPKGKQAFLIPWERFKADRAALLTANMKSVRFEASKLSRMVLASSLWADCQLAWVTGNWSIPMFHSWWKGKHEQSNHTVNPTP